MGNNVIAVGAYDDKETSLTSDDQLYSYSSYKNNNIKAVTFGVEKPDVIMPANILGGGTSSSAPILTSLVAQMLELRPSLAIHPEIIKAIVLASCHRKVLPSSTEENIETMFMGLTEKQGAGVADGWIMAAIVCQGTYGYGEINTDDNEIINILQPKYTSSNMNVSLSWIRECSPTNTSHNSFSDIFASDRYDLDLQIWQGNNLITESANEFSSTEMCYFPLSSDNDNYQINIYPYDQALNTRYGYAWSIDSMMAPLLTNSGLFRIKFKNTNNYVQYNSIGDNNSSKIILNSTTNYENLSDEYTWILNESSDGFSIGTGYGNVEYYINQSSNTLDDGLSYHVSMDSSPLILSIMQNGDGTCSIINNADSTILSSVGSVLAWKPYITGDTINDSEKLCLERINYIKGDVNTDGVINVWDGTIVQKINNELITPTNIQKFLSDVDLSGNINSDDVTRILHMSNDIYYH